MNLKERINEKNNQFKTVIVNRELHNLLENKARDSITTVDFLIEIAIEDFLEKYQSPSETDDDELFVT
jgi:hypothetical protein